jgi:hypothetical protein
MIALIVQSKINKNKQKYPIDKSKGIVINYKNMNINEVKTAKKIGDFKLKNNHQNKIDIDYLPNIPKNVLTDNMARIYLFVQDGVIMKIGGSASKGGIKDTMSPYLTSQTGSPGAPRFIIHLLISEALESKSKVELYMITSPKVLAKVNGLFTSKDTKIASFKEMEDFCKQDYYLKESKYPAWNFQENNNPYPAKLAEKHNLYHKNRLKNLKK